MQRAHTTVLRRSLLEDARAIIEGEFGDDLMLDDVARRVHTSRRQLQRCFVELGGETFRECLTRVRMDRAADMLRGGRLPVHLIARLTGYRQPAQFAKAFRRQHGIAPSAFRLAHRQHAGDDRRAA